MPSALIVNHQVTLGSSARHGSIGRHRLLYVANRPGAVLEKSEDDLRIERENARMAKLGYIAFRPGSVAESNAGHALFDQAGIPVRSEVQKELLSTESAILTSVVSVRREDAEAMRLSTRQDWERFLRAHWRSHVERMGIIAPEDIRWVAAFHVNQRNNLHAHVITWDASGRYDSLIPRRPLERARGELERAALRPWQEELNLVRVQSRDALARRVRMGDALDERAVRGISDALPRRGSLKYGDLLRSDPSAAEEVSAIVAKAVEGDGECRRLYRAYMEAVRGHGRARSLSGAPLEAYTAAAESDLRRRLANAAIGRARGLRREAGERPEAVGPEGYAPPAERRRLRAMREELGSSLDGSELAAVLEASGRWEASAEAWRALRKLPTASLLDTARPACAPASSFAGLAMEAGSALGASVQDGGPRDADDESLSAMVRAAAFALELLAGSGRLQATRPQMKKAFEMKEV